MDNYIEVINSALLDPTLSINVGDAGEAHDDLEDSRNPSDIIEACEATDSPVVTFFRDGESMGYMVVLVGYEDESIADYTLSEWMYGLMESIE